jgi:SAM-dependent methyltransferase
MDDDDHQACVEDIGHHLPLTDGMSVLDAGAGTGALCLALTQIPGLQINALEPSRAMGKLLSAKPSLSDISVVEGFCDHANDRDLFSADSFRVIASRQLANCLYDPLAAFRNWHHWLRPGGCVIVLDGHYQRSAWSGKWTDMVDTLPLSACQTNAAVPYLLEEAGFRVDFAGSMNATNARPSTRTKRYMVVATKPSE